MKTFRSLRILLLAMAVCVVPATSFAGVFISVGFAPPVLPVYDQPPCPEDGWIWTPGYWAYGDDGYYWVPGTWVPAPYEGALWTPPWWGWENNLYVFHPGYWGDHVGYYGGVNYGFGYMGIGFVGGMWRGRDFVYNTAVVHVDNRVIRNVYIDRTVVERNTIINDRHISFSGGRDGIHHDPSPQERMADRDRHVQETSFQHSHESAAMADRSFHAKFNGGHPDHTVMQRPMGGNWQQQNQGGNRGNYQNNGNAQRWNGNNNGDNRNNNQPGYQDRGPRNNNNAQPGYQNQGNRNNDYNAQPNNQPNQNRNFGGPPSNTDNRYNNNHRQSPGNNPPPANNNGYQQNRNNDNNGQRWNNRDNGNNGNNNRGNSQPGNGGNAPFRATTQPQSRPAPPPQPAQQQAPQQHNDQGNRGGDHGDRGHDRQH